MNEIKAIETVYNGHRFRSRLEARWAVFFDAIGIKYEYEPEGFSLDYGIQYLPDFALKNVHWRGEGPGEYYTGKPGNPVYVEVKGVDSYADIKLDERVRMEMFAKHRPLLVLGNIPANDWDVFHQHNWDSLMSFSLLDGDSYPAFFTVYCPPGGGQEIWICGPDHDQYRPGSADEAISIARQARFEHGEKPRF